MLHLYMEVEMIYLNNYYLTTEVSASTFNYTMPWPNYDFVGL